MRMLIRSVEVHVHFNARTRVDTVPERSPALQCEGTPKYEKRLTMPYKLKLNRILLRRSHIAVKEQYLVYSNDAHTYLKHSTALLSIQYIHMHI